MGEKFFYNWTREDIWNTTLTDPVINNLQPDDQAKVYEEFITLCDQHGTNFLKYVTDERTEPESLSNDLSNWSKYIKPALKSLQKEKYRRFNDPIHGTIELHPLLCKIIDTPEFHRLNDIKQLGGVHYVYSNARHTRFEHSIGVCYLAGEFARTLQKRQPELDITDKDVLCVEIAGLIHDLGHGPFSHMFEYGVYEQLKLEYPENFQKQPAAEGAQRQMRKWKHEKLSQKVFEDRIYKNLRLEFEKYGITKESADSDIDFINDLIHYKTGSIKKKEKAFLYQIVANKYCGIDVDKWDYFARDGHFIGVAHDFDFKRLMSMSRVIKVAFKEEKQWMICFRTKEMNNIYGMFRTRCSLFQRALHHRMKIAAELMLCRAIALSARAIELGSTLDGKPLQCSVLGAVLDAQLYLEDSSRGSLDGFLALTDSIIYAIKVADSKDSRLPPAESKKLRTAQDLLIRLAKRDLFHEVQLKEHPELLYMQQLPTDDCELKCLGTVDELQETLDKKLKHLYIEECRSVFVQNIDFKYGSESDNDSSDTDEDGASNSAQTQDSTNQGGSATQKDNDPVKKVYFYEKRTPLQASRGDVNQMMQDPTVALVRPQNFSIYQWKVYMYSDLDKQEEEIVTEIKKFTEEQKAKTGNNN